VYRPVAFLAAICIAALVPAAPARAQNPAGAAAAGASDLDAFMEKVLARREVNRKTLNDYVLDETETFEILGPARMRLHRTRRDYTWYVRDGMHVRSPVRFEGVAVGAEARDEYEQRWVRRERARRERRAKNEREKGEVSIGTDGVQVSGTTVPTEPRFVSEAYFMDFKFEAGNYYLAGREQLEGHDVLRIEYYPKRLFTDDDKKTPKELKEESRAQRREQELEDDIERKMNKTALVTLWVDPAEHQIVKYTFDNVWLDFLPGAWLVRVDDIRASMTMGQPFPGVWLPRVMNIHAGLTLASGSFEAGYERTFAEYREANVKTSIRVPKAPEDDAETLARGPVGFETGMRVAAHAAHGNLRTAAARGQRVSVRGGNATVREPELQPYLNLDARDEERGHGPFVEQEPARAAEVVREVRVHGNAFLADDDVLRLAGVTVGDPLPAGGADTIEKRLKDSGRFETVDVRKRYRSLADPTDVALVLVVHERPGITSAADTDNPVARPWRRFRRGLMFLPILSYADGYGFTYGGRVSVMNTLGIGERLSVPLTWGGTRRAAIEFERAFDRGPLTRVTSSFGIWNRENPRFDIRDQRVELKAGIERQFAQMVRLGAEATRSSVSFGSIDDRLWTVGTTAALDTRGNPAFPANAVYLGGGWTALNVSGLERINRYTADARGYLRVVGQAVLAGRALYANTDAALPQYERLLLGGSSTLRGFRTGSFDGDRMLVTSAEVRVPLTSVIRGARLGVSIFMDASKIADHGSSFDAVEWKRGAGAGVFLIASIVKINLDIARGLDGGGTRVHLGSGFSF
jgi:hypothetical protein